MTEIHKLGDICDIASGGTPSRSKLEYFKGDIPWVKIGDMSQREILKTTETISQLGLKNSSAKIFSKGTILISVFATIGRTSILGIDAATNQAIAGITPKENIKLDSKYLAYYLNSMKEYLESLSRGVAQPNINLSILKNLEIHLPSIEEQYRISKILDKADELRQKRQQAIEKLDQLLQATFIDMFGDPVSNPKNFELVKFSEIGKWKSGGTPSKTNESYWIGEFPWVSPKDMKVDHIFNAQDHISEKVFKETNLKKIQAGHLLIVVRGMILAHSFPTSINEVDISINQDMKAIEPIEKINVVYLKCAIDAFKPFVLELISDAAHGTKRFDLIYADLMKIPVPPMDLQIKFQIIYEKLKAERNNFLKQLSNYDKFFKSLQNQAFSGQL